MWNTLYILGSDPSNNRYQNRRNPEAIKGSQSSVLAPVFGTPNTGAFQGPEAGAVRGVRLLQVIQNNLYRWGCEWGRSDDAILAVLAVLALADFVCVCRKVWLRRSSICEMILDQKTGPPRKAIRRSLLSRLIPINLFHIGEELISRVGAPGAVNKVEHNPGFR